MKIRLPNAYLCLGLLRELLAPGLGQLGQLPGSEPGSEQTKPTKRQQNLQALPWLAVLVTVGPWDTALRNCGENGRLVVGWGVLHLSLSTASDGHTALDSALQDGAMAQRAVVRRCYCGSVALISKESRSSGACVDNLSSGHGFHTYLRVSTSAVYGHIHSNVCGCMHTNAHVYVCGGMHAVTCSIAIFSTANLSQPTIGVAGGHYQQ